MPINGSFSAILLFCLILIVASLLIWVIYSAIDHGKAVRFEVLATVVGKHYEPPMSQVIKDWHANSNSPAITPVRFPESHQLIVRMEGGKRGLPVDRQTYSRFKVGDRLKLVYQKGYFSKDSRLVAIVKSDGIGDSG